MEKMYKIFQSEKQKILRKREGERTKKGREEIREGDE